MPRRSCRRPWRPALAALVLLVSSAGPARAAPDVDSARSLGMGDALRGAATGSAALLYNPAGLALIRSYMPEADLLWFPAEKGLGEMVSIADSATSRVAAGMYYQHFSLARALSNGGPITATDSGHEAGLALALPISQAVLLGETTKYLATSLSVPGGLPREDRLFTEDVGLDLRLGETLSAAFIGQNLAKPGPNDPRTYSAGVAGLPIPALMLDVDASYDTTSGPGTRQRYLAGAEYFAGGRYPVRLGFDWDVARHATYGSMGLGVTTPQLALDLAARQGLSGGRELVIALSLRLFLNAAEAAQ